MHAIQGAEFKAVVVSLVRTVWDVPEDHLGLPQRDVIGATGRSSTARTGAAVRSGGWEAMAGGMPSDEQVQDAAVLEHMDRLGEAYAGSFINDETEIASAPLMEIDATAGSG